MSHQPGRAAWHAAFRRELAALRLNRFLHVHFGLAAVAGLLPLFTPGDAGAAAPWWVLQAVLYCLSLSSLLLGLSSAHGETDEFPLLFAQPAPRWAWLSGKVAGLALVVGPAALLLVAPTVLLGGASAALGLIAVATAGVSLALATCGLALGFWVRDPVRGLLATLGLWFVLLFGTDLVLLALAGSPAVHAAPALWIAPLMLNPLDALRVTVIFTLEGTASADAAAGGLAAWWLAHGPAWLTALLVAWTTAAFAVGLAGAQRRIDA